MGSNTLWMAKIEPYQRDLSEKEWNIVRKLLPESGKLGRPPRYSKRLVFNAILYVTRGGNAWRMLPHDFPHWRMVYDYFTKWHRMGVWQRLNDALRDRVRVRCAKKSPHGCDHRQCER